jgi:hypothetical protein
LRISVAILAALGATLVTNGATAQDSAWLEDHWPKRQQSRVQLDWDVWPSKIFGGNVVVTSLTWGIPIQIQLVEHVFLDAGLHWTVATADARGSDDGAAFGHIPIGAHYADNPLDILGWWAGGDLSIPTHLASDPDLFPAIAAGLAIASRGGAEPNRFAPEFLPLRFGGGVEIHPVKLIYLRTGLMLGNYIPLDSQDFLFVMEWPTEFEVRAPFGLGGGLGFQQIFPLTENDKIQVSIEHFIQYEHPGPGFHARLGWFWALDDTLGFAFEEGRVMSGRLSVGGHW